MATPPAALCLMSVRSRSACDTVHPTAIEPTQLDDCLRCSPREIVQLRKSY
ncbi:hypothetical protein [Thermoleptolyngbya sp.]